MIDELNPTLVPWLVVTIPLRVDCLMTRFASKIDWFCIEVATLELHLSSQAACIFGLIRPLEVDYEKFCVFLPAPAKPGHFTIAHWDFPSADESCSRCPTWRRLARYRLPSH